jgi:hypothetical protein
MTGCAWARALDNVGYGFDAETTFTLATRAVAPSSNAIVFFMDDPPGEQKAGRMPAAPPMPPLSY